MLELFVNGSQYTSGERAHWKLLLKQRNLCMEVSEILSFHCPLLYLLLIFEHAWMILMWLLWWGSLKLFCSSEKLKCSSHESRSYMVCYKDSDRQKVESFGYGPIWIQLGLSFVHPTIYIYIPYVCKSHLTVLLCIFSLF